MEIFITAMIVMAMVCVMAHLWMKNAGGRERSDKRMRSVPWIVLAVVVVVLLDLIAGDFAAGRLAADLMAPALCLYLMSFSLCDHKDMSLAVKVLMAMELVPAVYYLLCICGIHIRFPQWFFTLYAAAVSLAFPLVFAAVFRKKLKTVRDVMKSGNVWSFLCVGVDAVYASVFPFFMILFLLILMSGWDCGEWLALLPLACSCGAMVALALRICNDSLFLLWTEQERRIVESMKVTNVSSAPDHSHIEEVYKDVYERIVAYFDREKPYLDSELAIADLVKVLYSNKLYISRAISQFTGRNFRQFVNYHRVRYSMECFRENPDMKVHEMGAMSGFNSVVSFNMAFRLFMGENPSDWCRKEKGRMVKGKK